MGAIPRGIIADTLSSELSQTAERHGSLCVAAGLAGQLGICLNQSIPVAVDRTPPGAVTSWSGEQGPPPQAPGAAASKAGRYTCVCIWVERG